MYHDPLTQAVAYYGATPTENEEIARLERKVEEIKKQKGQTIARQKRLNELHSVPMDEYAYVSTLQKLDEKIAQAQAELEEAQAKLSIAKRKRDRNPYVSGAMFLLSATAMAVSYSRNQSILKSLGASFVAVPYLIYVAIDSRKK